MGNKIWRVLVLVVAGAVVSGCVPVVLGAAGAVVADQVVEQREGGDGLF